MYMGSVCADSISARIIKNTFIQTIDMYEYILSDFCCNAKPFPLYNCNPKGCGNPGGYGITGGYGIRPYGTIYILWVDYIEKF